MTKSIYLSAEEEGSKQLLKQMLKLMIKEILSDVVKARLEGDFPLLIQARLTYGCCS